MNDKPRPGPLSGYRVLEVAEWVMVPGAAAILSDWGADVIKVEHATRGDVPIAYARPIGQGRRGEG